MKHKRTSQHFPTEPMALYCDNQRSPHTAKNAIRLWAFTRWLESVYRVTELESITTAHILAYKQSLAHLAPSSQARFVETLLGTREKTLCSHPSVCSPNKVAECTRTKCIQSRVGFLLAAGVRFGIMAGIAAIFTTLMEPRFQGTAIECLAGPDMLFAGWRQTIRGPFGRRLYLS